MITSPVSCRLQIGGEEENRWIDADTRTQDSRKQRDLKMQILSRAEDRGAAGPSGAVLLSPALYN